MIVADRREGSLQNAPEPHSGGARLWRNLDRSIPLGIKLVIPVILVSLAGTGLFGLLLLWPNTERARLLLQKPEPKFA